MQSFLAAIDQYGMMRNDQVRTWESFFYVSIDLTPSSALLGKPFLEHRVMEK